MIPPLQKETKEEEDYDDHFEDDFIPFLYFPNSWAVSIQNQNGV